jgi:tetratricopeptide (TPR) repeat protein
VDAGAPFDRARTLAAMGRMPEALALLDEVLRADPAHHGGLLLRAELHAEEREWEEALVLNERAVTLWPRSAEALNALARRLHARGRDEEAMKLAHEARALLGEGDNFTQTAAVYLTLVWCLARDAEVPGAIAAARKGSPRMPDAVLAHWATEIEEELIAAEKERC